MALTYIITTSEDGLQNIGASNIKALDRIINEVFKPAFIMDSKDKFIKYSYSNLVKEIKARQKNNRFFVAGIYNKEQNENLSVYDMYITSK